MPRRNHGQDNWRKAKALKQITGLNSYPRDKPEVLQIDLDEGETLIVAHWSAFLNKL